MAIQQLATLWTPDEWIAGIAEKQATFPALFNSKAVMRSNRLKDIATGPGTVVNVPFLKDITDQANEVQIEHVGPTTVNGAPGDVCLWPVLNRVTKNAWTAMCKNVSGADVVGHVYGSMGQRRLKQNQTTLLAMLRGLLGTAGAINAAAALSAVRYGGVTAEPFIENGLSATDANLMSPDLFIYTKALLGELANNLKNGVMFLHTDVKARLEVLDADNFKTGKPSDLPFEITTYRDIPLIVSEALVRAGTGGGYVYDTYIIAEGTIGYGEKDQAGDTADLASLQYYHDKDLNDELVYDRQRITFGLDGTSFTGTPSASSATDAELQTTTNWALKYQSAKRVGVAAIRTNG